MANSTAQTSIIIPNYNNARHLRTCLEKIIALDDIQEIIVVDDASTDNSIEIIKQFPVRLIQNPSNVGPTKSRNIGAQQATGKFLLFLDSDVALTPTYIPELVAFFAAHSLAGVASGKIISQTGERIWHNFGYNPSHFKDPIAHIIHKIVLAQWRHTSIRKVIVTLATPFTQNLAADSVRKVDWVIEMACMVRRNIFEQVGGFDEQFRMFYEGPDLCRRFKQIGYTTYYIPQAQAHDLGSHSHASAVRKQYFKTSRARYFKKYR